MQPKLKPTAAFLASIAMVLFVGCGSPAKKETVGQHAAAISSPTETTATAPTKNEPVTPVENPVAEPAKHGIDALQGSWSGMEMTPGHEDSAASISFTGNVMEYDSDDALDWAKGTVVVDDSVEPHQCIATFTDGPSPDIAGQKCYIIYKIEDGALTITGSPPGATTFPAR